MRRIALIPIFLLGACSMVPDYMRPSMDFLDSWDNAAPAAPVAPVVKEIPVRWWEAFNSPNLNQLVDQALAQNNDLAASIARVKQARADAQIARAALYPQVDLSAGDSRTVVQSKSGSKSRSDRAGLAVSYEVDLFGANRASAEAAEHTALASEFDRDALALVVASDVTSTYLSLVTTTEQLRLADENLRNGKEVLKVVQAQFDAGRVSGQELAQQKNTVAELEAAIATFIQQQEIDCHQLAVLVGAPPQNFVPKLDPFNSLTAPQVAPTLPSAVLEQRPDVRSAEYQLKAANADIGVARAAFFPSLTIGADASLTRGIGSALGLSADALQPIFHGGALEGQLEVAKERKEELVANYRQAVLTAFQESSDALSALKSAQSRDGSLAEAAKQAEEAYKIANTRYLNGAIDYQSLLDTQRSLFSSQDSYAVAHLDQLQAATSLYKALGGAPDKEKRQEDKPAESTSDNPK